MYLQYVKQVWAVVRVALAKVAGKLFFSRGTLPLKAKPSLKEKLYYGPTETYNTLTGEKTTDWANYNPKVRQEAPAWSPDCPET